MEELEEGGLLMAWFSPAPLAAWEGGKDLLAVMVAALGGMAVIAYAAASELFELKLFKFDPFSLRIPKETRVEYWYTRGARKFWEALFSGGWSYAKFKKRARVAVKLRGREFRREARRRMPEQVRRLNRDIAIGTLVIALVLVALLVLNLT